MLGAIEILIILIIFGIIYGRDAIDKTFRKHADETVVESLSEDFKDYYKENPKRLKYIAGGVLGGFIFLCVFIYWVLTRTNFMRMIGL